MKAISDSRRWSFSKVPSVDSSSITSQRSGRLVCATTASATSSMCSASLWTGVISRTLPKAGPASFRRGIRLRVSESAVCTDQLLFRLLPGELLRPLFGGCGQSHAKLRVAAKLDDQRRELVEV